jgi:tRNA nucleotidyltransferase (CCA-adding enzyme)
MRIENLDVDLVAEGDGIIFAKALAEAFGGRLRLTKIQTRVVRLPGGGGSIWPRQGLEILPVPGACPE